MNRHRIFTASLQLLLLVAIATLIGGCDKDYYVGYHNFVGAPVMLSIDKGRGVCDVHYDVEGLYPQQFKPGTRHTFYTQTADPEVFHATGHFDVMENKSYPCAGVSVPVVINIGRGVQMSRPSGYTVTYTSMVVNGVSVNPETHEGD